ncbi:aminotransferase class III-fold pyridoxal phosphate-dependent enzyme [Enterobacter hormaechei]
MPIIDEVMTGFRVALAGAVIRRRRAGSTCPGKIMGGGMPVGAFGGRKDVMNGAGANRSGLPGGTLSGNPIAMAAGFACLTESGAAGHPPNPTDRTTQLANGLLEAAEDGVFRWRKSRRRDVRIFFTEAKTVTCYQDVVKCDVERLQRLRPMLEEGVSGPRQRLKRALCPWHTAKKISITPSTQRVRCLRSCKMFGSMPTPASPTGRGSKPGQMATGRIAVYFYYRLCFL